MATTYTELLQLPKHSTTDPFDITLINNMADLVDAGMARAYQGKAAHNHLDNTMFEIAQAGYNGTHGTTVYAADRWPATTWNATLDTVCNAGTMHLSGGASGSNAAYVRQTLPADHLAGKTITASIEVISVASAGGARLALSNNGTASGNAKTYTYTAIKQGMLVVQMEVPTDATTVTVTIGNHSNHSGTGEINFTFQSPALYVGAYTANTLPDFQPKGYAAELAECQRYYVKTSGQGYGYCATADTIRLNVPVPTTMRVVPSVESGLTFRVYVGGSRKDVTSYSVNNVFPGVVQLTLTGTFTQNENIVGYATAQFGLSADL